MKTFQRPILLASCLGLLAGIPASAWEWVYGPQDTADDAYRRVHPVPSCGPSYPDPGYIAIGTQNQWSDNPDVLVVYTDVNGNAAAGWEATYDVESLGLIDDGMAIVSIPDRGYVFLSNTWNGVWRPALTFIDCRGNVIWTQVYADLQVGEHMWGNDLIRTQTGDPAFGTAPGDFAVAGWWRNRFITLNEDAFLMRTDANGILRWNTGYNLQNLNQAFNGLTEALPVAPALTGDLVAVGRHLAGGNEQGLVARVDGNNGAIGTNPLQCMQHHGAAASAESYEAVTRLQTVFPGQFAIVGSTRDAAWAEDIWVTRTNSCGIAAQARFGGPAGSTRNEVGNDIVEVLVPKPGTPAGSLAIAGYQQQAGNGTDAALLVLDPALFPLFGQSRLFGDFGNNVETFYSLAEDPAGWPIAPGYVLAGLTRTPWFGPDPGDLYLVHEDPAVFACELPWSPSRFATAWPQVAVTPARRAPAEQFPVPTAVSWQRTGQRVCAP